jgi:oligopeptide/dipeptide ABC transporter ATP-binding protein
MTQHVEADQDLLQVQDLHLHIHADGQVFRALNGVSFEVRPREIYGLIGETGAGKSLSAWAVMGLLPSRAEVVSGSIVFRGQQLTALSDERYRRLRGNEMALVVQNPKGSLHPLRSVGRQIATAYRQHKGGSRRQAWQKAVEALTAVGVSDPTRRARSLPEELSGGMAQRVLIAAAMVNEPKLLVADEPTTGLDVTVQAQILETIRSRVTEQGVSVLLITHDLGVVAQFCDRVGVMFAGRIVEEAPVRDLFEDPRHPYTRKLIAAARQVDANAGTDAAGDLGLPPDLTALPEGCHYAYRCPYAAEVCRRPMVETSPLPGRRLLCHRPDVFQIQQVEDVRHSEVAG